MNRAPTPTDDLDVRALAVLRERFGFSRFRQGQVEIIFSVLAGRDVLGVMPTGGGKSLGYALPALLLDRPVLVVSPLIALMKDQVDALLKKRIPAGYINSTVPPDEQRQRVQWFRDGTLRLLFVAPERFRSPRFLEALEGFRPGLFAVDEAHCISEWGHDFRPDYLKLREAAEALGRPPILALTATATAEVRRHIVENLALREPTIVVKGFERPNLDFAVERCVSRDDKEQRCITAAREGGTGIVYAATRKNVERTAMILRKAGLAAGYYHAGLADADRRMVQERFASGQLPIVVATNAFGMGIDRADLRFVIHLDLPGSVEAYTQEAGRAGRDGEPARCTLLYAQGDARLQRFFIDTSYPAPAVILETMDRLKGFGEDAIVDEGAIAPHIRQAQHPRAVDSALRVLTEHGVVQRGIDRDGKGRVVRFVEERDLDFDLLRARAEREYVRLQHVTDYAERAGCHRAYLVNYFAGDGAAPPCGNCEGCRRTARRRELAPREREAVLATLTMVRSLNGRYGRRRLAGLLSGSRAKEILAAGLERHPQHGALKGLRPAFVDSLLNECVATGLLEIEGAEYPVLAITQQGRRVLSGQAEVHLSCFDELPPRTLGRDPRVGERGGAASGVEDGGETVEEPDEGPPDPRLVERLRTFRRERASELGLPPYCVFNDRTMLALARRRPANKGELLQVKGIGPSTLERFGAAILELVREEPEGGEGGTPESDERA